MLPDEASTAAGMLLPLNEPSRGALVPVPSWTLTKSYPCSVANELNTSVIGAPVVICQLHTWQQKRKGALNQECMQCLLEHVHSHAYGHLRADTHAHANIYMPIQILWHTCLHDGSMLYLVC